MCTAVPESLMSLGFEGFFKTFIWVFVCVSQHKQRSEGNMLDPTMCILEWNTSCWDWQETPFIPNPYYNLYERVCVCVICTHHVYECSQIKECCVPWNVCWVLNLDPLEQHK